MSKELKVTVSDDRHEFLREHFRGISDADRLRSMMTLMEYLLEDGPEEPDFDEIFTDEAVDSFDPEEIVTEALKRALLESDDVDLSNIPLSAFKPDTDSDSDSDTDDES